MRELYRGHGAWLMLAVGLVACGDPTTNTGAGDLGGTLDGGVDAARPDRGAETTDAAVDAGRDGSPPDATPPDASPPDGTPPDATPPDAGPTCRTNDDCGPGEACAGGACVPRCEPGGCGDGHCGSAWVCEDGPCEGDATCAAGAWCGEGTCREGCRQQPDTCPDGERCGPDHACVPGCEPQPEVCNGRDDDCDGESDEGLDVGGACQTGLGACARDGVRACNDRFEVVCEGPLGEGSDEICNGVDDDCDGDIDDGLGLGEPCAAGAGACRAEGVQVCGDAGAVVCDATPGEPGRDLCNGVDDDCDGTADEGYGVGEACQTGQGGCLSVGAWVCAPDGGSVCDAAPPQGVPEVCNGEDDDCDGQVDDGLGGAACQTGLPGVCGVGARACEAGEIRCWPAVEPRPETCDGTDEDCDGQIDEDTGTAPCGEGVCRRELPACGPDGAPAACDPLVGAQDRELCNGLDDDCDGQIDEDAVGDGEPCGAGVGACQRAGVRVCVGGAQVCDAQPGQPELETCNGVDDDCDGVVDDGALAEGAVCDVGVGACVAAGRPVCADGRVICEGEPGPPGQEVCDGVDNNCDGDVDEGFGEPCGVGQCRRILAACDGGDAAACDPLVGAEPERCDGVDNDCDGEIDEAVAGLGQACQAGAGACALPGLTACVAGAEQCVVDDAQRPDEVCNGLDDDCDGQTDEQPVDEGAACSAGRGACEVAGALRCMGGNLTCDALAGAPSDEVCNGEDDDCDGTPDDGLGTAPCGVGVCARQIAACVDGAPGACDPLLGAGVEICNGLDDDCDGEIDEGTGGAACALGVGACRAEGVEQCQQGQLVCDAVRAQPQAEVCNGVDDDCDGDVDDGLGLGAACALGVGACAANGAVICGPDGATTCDAAVIAPVDELCNGLDDDCDGQIDDGIAAAPCATGEPGVCGAGTTACEAGAPRCVPDAAPAAEVCDGLDNDCDGQVDDGLGTVACGEGACARDLPACADGAPVACDPLAGAGDEVCNGLDDDCDGQIDEGLGGAPCRAGVGACAVAGLMSCREGAMACDAVAGQPGVELCNGVDDDCDGQIDDAPTDVGPCAAGVGACLREAQTVCEAGALRCPAVAGAPSDEVCNGADDDCDGELDEGFGSTVCGVGACRHAVPNCAGGGAPVACDPMEGAGAEICNGVDDDCDGTVDEGAPGGGDNCAVGEGACRVVAVTRCIDGAITCPARPLAARLEVCDRVDNDCDGQVDEEAQGTGEACTYGVGACAAEGQVVCFDGSIVCDARPADPVAEQCNGVDDDCNGRVDDGLEVTCGVGACQRTINGCVDGAAAACVPFEPRPEICDGVDNDCDGQTDEGQGDTVCGLGECQQIIPRCVNGALNACPAQQGAVAEICDGLDNDCDGVVDDGVAPRVCSRGQGICRRQDFEQCHQGAWNCLAQAADVAAPETCNTLDDDCDGQVDEAVPEAGQACERGIGACRDVQITRCEAGFVVCPAVAGDAVVEVCNDVDDDCDGQTDEVGPDCDGNGQGDDCDVAEGAADCNANGIPDVCDISELRSGDCNGNGVPDECNGDGDGCVPDVTAPVVDLFLQGTVVNAGTTIQTRVNYVEDGSGVDQIGLTLDGQVVPLDQNRIAFVELTRPGFQTFVGWVTDQAGNRGEHVRQVRVLDPTDGARPVIQIHSPANGAAVFADVVFNISVSDASLTDWWLTWGPNGNPAAQEIARGTEAVAAADVAFIGIGGLQAGVYQFQLTAIDVNGAGSRITGSFQVPDCTPEPEVCNYTDDDCDGVADDGVVGLGAPCVSGVGECRRAGTGVCAEDGTVMCDEPVGLPQVEQCDGLDNDCDGSVDERWPVGQACALGEGACSRPGTVVCTADATAALCDAVPGDPGVEACNGLDDDCDGQVDEGIRGCGVDAPPAVNILRPNGDAPAPGNIEIVVEATDDFGVASLTLTVDGVDEPLDAQGTATPNLRPGRYALLATAVDDQGQSSTDAFTLWVNDPLDNFNPFVQIDQPRPDQVIALPFAIRGSAADETLVEWVLTLEPPADGGAPIELARGDQEIGNDVLAELDPQAMPNGVWNLVLWAVDANHRASSVQVRVRIEGCVPQPEICDGADQDCDNVADEGLVGCAGDVTPPDVQLTWSGDRVNVGDAYQVAVFATDDVWVDRRAVAINGVEQPAEEGVLIDVPLAQAGRLMIEARAWDTAGNLGSQAQMVRVMDPADADAPVIEIVAPAVGDAIDGPVAITGRINDQTPWAWAVYRGTEANPEAVLLAEGTENIDGVLGVFDAGALPDGPIVIRVVAEDVNGRRRTLDWPLRVRPCEPAPDVCDGVDNDCDGAADEDFLDLGQPCQVGFGECQAVGQLVCAGGGQFTVCDAVPIEPQPERCDALDHDCNGRTTNGFDLGQFCQAGVGACVRDGRTVCNITGDGVACDAVPGVPGAEICDQIDNDCDGQIDEGFPQIECGVGACFRVIGACEGLGACDPLAGAQPEICNEIDDDCDGAVDEDPIDAGQACFDGVGVCRRAGTVICAGGVAACDAVAGPPGAEICDTLDNDCDGEVDEGFVCPDEVDPVVNVVVAPNPVTLGQAVTITVTATDERGPPQVVATVNGAPLALDGNGQATYVPDAFGAFTVEVVVTDDAGNQTVETITAAVRDPNDNVAPVVSITGPAAYSEVGAPVAITGSVADDTLVSWTLEYEAISRPNTWIEFARGDQPVAAATLGLFDTTMLENGVYRIMLTARDANGRIARDFLRLKVVGEAKVGIFTITYTDTTVPVAGMPLTVQRTYDSRVKASGAFGVGWRLDIKQGTLEHSHPIHDGWAIHPGGFLGLPCQQSGEAVPHTTEIELSKGERYVFRPQLIPAGITLGGCFARIQYTFVHGTRPGRARLEAIGVGQVLWVNNSETLVSVDGELVDVSRARLTTADGRTFDLSIREKGVTFVEDRNQNSVSIRDDGLHHSAGKSVEFIRDGAGRITEAVLPGGDRLLYTYDGQGDLVAFTNTAGDVVSYRYDQKHNLIEIIDPTGNTPARNEYDEDGRLVAVVYPDGSRVVMDHDINSRIEVTRDRLGATEIFEYDERGNVLSKVDKRGNTWRFTYDADDRVLSETDPDGNITRRTYNAVGQKLTESNGLGHETRWIYDAAGWLERRIDRAGNETRYTYDAVGNRTSVTDATGAVTTYTYDDNGMQLTETDDNGDVLRTEYTAEGAMARKVSKDGAVNRYEYDERGNRITEILEWTGPDGPEEVITRFEYDTLNKIVAQTDPIGGRRTISYDSRGNKVAETDPGGRRTTWQWDDLNHNVRKTWPDGGFELYEYDAEGRQISVIDRNGRETRTTYDAVGNPVRIDYADGTHGTLEYDSRNNVIREVDRRGSEMRRRYDAANRLVEEIDAEGRITTYTYDAMNRRTSVTGPDGQTTRYEHDAAGRETAIIFPDGARRTMEYDGVGNKVAESDAAGITARFAYDGMGRLTRVTDPLGNDTVFEHDEMGRKTAVIDPLGRRTTYRFDQLGRLVGRTLPSGRSETAEYDSVGNVVGRVDLAGQAFAFTYDQNDRLVRRALPDGTFEIGTWTPTGKRATTEDAQGITRWRYDANERPVERVEADGVAVRHTYDAIGNPLTVTTPVGVTTYTYDTLGRMETVTDPHGGVTTYTYTVDGSRESVTLANGTVTRYEYDGRRRLVAQETTAPDGGLVSRYLFTLGDAGERQVVHEVHTGRTSRYTYDALYRLVRELLEDADGAVIRDITYTYDAVGNRLTRTVDGVQTLFEYDVDDQLVAIGGVPQFYDGNGRLSQIGQGPQAITQTYDTLGRMIEVDTPDARVEYTYDVDGHRIGRRVEVGAQVELTRYVIDKQQRYAQVLAELDGNGAVQVEYLYGQDLLAQWRGGTERWYLLDGQMSVRQLADADGAITDTYAYDAFGVRYEREGQTPNDHQFGGQFLDPNTGHYYLRARWYDPQAGRFMVHDPVDGLEREPQSLHRYAYALNNPVNNQDPSGEFLVSITISFGIQGSLRSSYISHMLTFLMKTMKVAFCVLEPAYKARENAMMEMVGGVPGGDLRYALAMKQLQVGFQSILRDAKDMYKALWDDITEVKEETHRLHTAHIEALRHCNYYWCRNGASLQKMEIYKEKVQEDLFSWQKLAEAAWKVYDGWEGIDTACNKAKTAGAIADALLMFMPSF